MALGLQSRNQRRSPRIDVLLRVKGELVPIGAPISLLNLSRTGFAVLSEAKFRAGDRVYVRISGLGHPAALVTAAAVHAEPRREAPGVFLTGFEFEPGRDGMPAPGADILALLAAAAPAGFKF